MKKNIMFALLLTFGAIQAVFAQSGDLEVVSVDPEVSPLQRGQTTRLVIAVNQNGPDDLPVGSARVTISIDTRFINWVTPLNITDECGNIWTVQTTNVTPTTAAVQLRNNSGVLASGMSCLISLPIVGVSAGDAAITVGSTVFGPGVSDPNGNNQAATSSITVIENTPVAPRAVNDMLLNVKDTDPPRMIAVLSNDIANTDPIDPARVRLIDPRGNEVITLTVAGKGAFAANPDGTVTFTPQIGFSGSVIVSYNIKDIAGRTSNQATITVDVSLPVTLVNFRVNNEGNAALLEWATSEETNSDCFEIQRSADGKSWAKIGKVPSQGESKILRSYSFVDDTPFYGENLYRLRMVDADGTFAFSSISSVHFGGIPLYVYPNPVAVSFSIKGEAESFSDLSILDLSGKVIYEKRSEEKAVDVSGLPNGFYVVRVTMRDGGTWTQKIMIRK
ncbi:T9SS type A sorting domain-containing protein [Dyadobacter sp. CY261]|uniref:T9SS type A sorting domain-containing protein n=1 Tax=Dyadobacter sp. CY261 TaxID=2907203 RepID=UPI001F380597|nr:T9SS type A sorting domain-containing protein [Dyadobacter sp. CY261]MCF0072749.1 T9SS type A sorting domain-containing protein [Dyadobacter sp. CY261]